jgi:hypothetical protein
LSQGLEDHAHVRTLKKLHSLDPDIPIIAPPSARGALVEAGFLADSTSSSSRVRFLKHGEDAVIEPRGENNSNDGRQYYSRCARVRATEGALVGPPWQRRENGYILSPADSKIKSFPSLYIEPHVEFNQQELKRIGSATTRTRRASSTEPAAAGSDGSVVDVVISPICGQTLPAFELVHGPADTIRLLETLRPKYLVPMRNGNVNMKGPLAALVSEVGSDEDFLQRLVAASLSSSSGGVQIVEAPPGEDVTISIWIHGVMKQVWAPNAWRSRTIELPFEDIPVTLLVPELWRAIDSPNFLWIDTSPTKSNPKT